MAWPKSINKSSTPVELPGEDCGGNETEGIAVNVDIVLTC